MMKMEKGFTLAEVLITLGIIGVVAALTIPTLMANYQKTAEVAGLKKSYSEVTQALQLMANDMGCQGDLECTGLFNNDGDVVSRDTIFGNEFKKYFKLAKDCGVTYNSNNSDDQSKKCFSDSISTYYDGSDSRWDMDSNFTRMDYAFITADGFAIAVGGVRDCNAGENIGANFNLNKICGEVYIDINGFKGPNNFGRDIFYFTMTNGRGPAFYPYGGHEWLSTAESEYWAYKCNSNWQAGMYCAARIMEEGWQMKY